MRPGFSLLPIGLAAFACGTAASAAVCSSISAKDVLTESASYGFSTLIVPNSRDSGTCSNPNDVVFAAVAGMIKLSCDVRLLGGRRLAAGWSVSRYQLVGAPYQHEEPAPDNPSIIRFSFSAEPSRQMTVRLTSIELVGPDCANWREAFRNSVPMSEAPHVPAPAEPAAPTSPPSTTPPSTTPAPAPATEPGPHT